MSSVLGSIARLKPEVRLAQAISQFVAELSDQQKAEFRSIQEMAASNPPGVQEVMNLTAKIDNSSKRCFGPRVTKLLQTVQEFCALGDTLSSQNIIACGVWSAVRMTLLCVSKYTDYFERLSHVLMTIGRTTPRYQAMAAVYPDSKKLQEATLEYMVVIVELCRYGFKMSSKPFYQQWMATVTDTTLRTYEAQLQVWASTIKEEANLSMAQLVAREANQSSGFRARILRKADSDARAEKQKALQDALDMCSCYDFEADWRKIRKQGSVTILGSCDEYKTWKSTRESATLIWRGNMGAGKSVILANIIDDLNLEVDHKTLVIYFFCQHDNDETLKSRAVIGSFARQILRSGEVDSDGIIGQFTNGKNPNVEELLQVLKNVVPPNCHAYLLLDDLQHCEATERFLVLKALGQLQRIMPVSVCVSSRGEPSDIADTCLERLLNVRSFTMPAENPDIDTYINEELERCINTNVLVLNDPSIILEIHDILSKRAQGMFLWVTLQIMAVCLEATDADIRIAISNLPTELSEIYGRILSKAGPADRTHQERLLGLVVAARRPLTTEEMAEAFSVEPGHTVWEPQRLPHNLPSHITSCGGLLTISEEDSTISVIHHSVKTFLTDGHHGSPAFNVQRAHQRMDEIVITYLNYDVFSNQVSVHGIPRISSGSISSSAISAAAASVGRAPRGKTQKAALKLLQMVRQPDRNIAQDILAVQGQQRDTTATDPFAFHVYAAKEWHYHLNCLDLHDTKVRDLLMKQLRSINLNKTDPNGSTFLSRASDDGNTELMQILLRAGAWDRVHAPGKTALIQAIKTDNLSVIRSLLGLQKSDVNSPDEEGRTPLMIATMRRNSAIVEILLHDREVDVNAQDYRGRSPLTWAAANNFTAGVMLLLRHRGIMPDQQDGQGYGPTYATFGPNSDELTLVMVSVANLDIGFPNSRGKTPLWVAAAGGHQHIVEQLLVLPNVVADHKIPNGKSALWVAASHGHLGVVQSLIRSGRVSVDQVDNQGRTPLWQAASKGRTSVVSLLSAADGVDVNHADGHGATALWIAAANGHAEVVRILRDCPCTQLGVHGLDGMTAEGIAHKNGHKDVVDMLQNTA